MIPNGRWRLTRHSWNTTSFAWRAVRFDSVASVGVVCRTWCLVVVCMRTVTLMIWRTDAFSIIITTISHRIQWQDRPCIHVQICPSGRIRRSFEMIRMTIQSWCTIGMPVSILHTHVISPVIMAWSSSIVEAILHVLIVPGLAVAAMVSIGMMRMVRWERHTRTISWGGSSWVGPPRRSWMAWIHRWMCRYFSPSIFLLFYFAHTKMYRCRTQLLYTGVQFLVFTSCGSDFYSNLDPLLRCSFSPQARKMNGDSWYDPNIFSLCIVYFPSSFDFSFYVYFAPGLAQGLNVRRKYFFLHNQNGTTSFYSIFT